MTSTMSVESDWSSDERDELEKIFGEMSEKGEEYAKLRQAVTINAKLHILANFQNFIYRAFTTYRV